MSRHHEAYELCVIPSNGISGQQEESSGHWVKICCAAITASTYFDVFAEGRVQLLSECTGAGVAGISGKLRNL